MAIQLRDYQQDAGMRGAVKRKSTIKEQFIR